MESVKLAYQGLGMRFQMPGRRHAPIVFNLPHQGQESPEERDMRQGSRGGFLALQSEGLCSAAGFTKTLEEAEYCLVDGYIEGRLGAAPGIENFKFTIARFLWEPISTPMPEGDCVYTYDDPPPGARNDFEQLLKRNLWVVQIYQNPGGLSINFSHRQPLYRPKLDGSGEEPVTVWPKDAPRNERGKRIGTPLPLKPDLDLRVVDGAIKLVPVE